ncbi:type VI secretion system-associated FHA domain protein TagH [Methylobacterium sp. J-068]|uniref:type VI secretion system-associated FHA domain protein TagH n=1 Tax=Methylobacterium sp. J-068 TaxID=2836649 RepID=UPI001FBB7D4E|nr:type VI secretion system-associated FHA domain protein TagH [Methylobacterium sp. J-068]MCJ2033866.1 type VI secretion system-associated FHA domain protein TagH [Methylobacterium sp. J-068]
MALRLTIENHTFLPDGGPLSVSVTGRRGIDIGRDQYLDWTLPDTERVISGKHAEVRHQDGAYWLHDVSRNGVYLNRNPQRIQGPHRLKDGDRIQIGQYLIVAEIDGAQDAVAERPDPGPGAASGDYWGGSSEAPPPIPSRDLRPRGTGRPVQPDFVDWAVDVAQALPPIGAPSPRRALDPGHDRAPPQDGVPAQDVFRAQGMPAQDRPAQDRHAQDMDWAPSPPPVAPPAPPPMPNPRRPPPDETPWGQGQASSPPVANAWQAGAEAWGAPAAAPAASVRPPITEDVSPPPPAPQPPRGASGNEEWVARFAKGAGIAPELVGWRDPGDLAEEAGILVRLAAENLKQLLAARAETKRAARATSQTSIQALDNNPLKFAPTVEDALRIMLGRPTSGYLDARRALETGFRDLKTHQIKTYSAMQNALRLLLDDLDPDTIAESDEGDRGLAGLLGSRKARLWDLYATRWDALASQHEDGMVDAFLIFFADCYDRGR